MNAQKHCIFVMTENSIEIGSNGTKLGPKVTPYILYPKSAQEFFLKFLYENTKSLMLKGTVYLNCIP